MLYTFFRVVVRFCLKIFFGKIELSGLEHIKPGKAQILASNHPSGFLEPLIMACFFPRSLYFLVRGDVFENRFLKPVLVATHQLPIYRFKDGFSKLRENRNSLQAASMVLLQKKCILIFAEGSTKSVKMLRPLQKGFVRLAADTQHQNREMDIEIVPVGINFSDSTKFRSKVMLRVGKPVDVDKERIVHDHPKSGEYQADLMQMVYDAMKENVIHLSDQSRYRTMEIAFDMDGMVHNDKHMPTVISSDKNLERYKKLAECIDSMDEAVLQEFKEETKSLLKELKQIRLSPEDLMKRPPGLLSYLFLIVGFFPASAGIIIHILPLAAAYFFTVKNVKSKEFFGSIWFVTSVVMLLLLYLTLVILMLTGTVPWYVLPSAAFTGYFAVLYYSRVSSFGWHKTETRKLYKHKFTQVYKKYFTGL